MLKLIESDREKIDAQKVFSANMKRSWKFTEQRRVVWKQDSRVLEIAHNRNFWSSSIMGSNGKIAIAWNSFGKYSDKGGLQSIVLINIPIDSNIARYAGFFAKDDFTQEIYLMHDGGVGGGRTGVGRDEFLAWSAAEPMPVLDSKGNVRHGVIVSPIKSPRIGQFIERYIQSVFDFKTAVASGEIISIDVAGIDTSYSGYVKEYWGKKSGKRAKEFEYISRHGEIVHSLQEWRRNKVTSLSKSMNKKEHIFNTGLIDLGVQNSEKKLIELYEVKTNADRQSLYTAIGQLGVHGCGSDDNLKRYIVLPYKEKITNDIKLALDVLGIQIIWFEMDSKRVTILE